MKYTSCTPIWVKFGKIQKISFVGRDVICKGKGCHLIFINLLTGEELLYRADSGENGEGVSCFSGHKSVAVFAFAEKRSNPRILIKTYPGFKSVSELPNAALEGYVQLQFGDTSELFSINDLPTFLITIWNWRSGDKITTIKSDILQANQILNSSATKPLSLAQLNVKTYKLYVWDVLQCGRECFVTKNVVKTDKCTAPLSNILWTSDGGFLVLDLTGNVYTMTADYQLVTVIEGSEKLHGYSAFTWYKAGLLIATPNNLLQHYRKAGSWTIDWTCKHTESCTFLAASVKDHLIVVSESFELLRFNFAEQSFISLKPNETEFSDLCLIYPTGEYIVTLSHQKRLTTWKIDTGKEMHSIVLKGQALAIKENPEFPYIGVTFSHGLLELYSIYEPEIITLMASFLLTRNPLSSIYFTEIGRLIVAADMTSGQFFIIEGIPGTKMQIIATVEAQCQIADYILVASRTCFRLFILAVTSNLFIAGKKLIRYCIIKGQEEADLKEYILEDDTQMYSRLYATTKKNRDRVFYAIPFSSKHIHEIETKRADAKAKVINIIRTGHQLRKIALSIDKHHLISYAYDGLVIIHTSAQEEIGLIMPHHRLDGGVTKAFIDPLSQYVVSLGRDNTLVCTCINDTVINTERQAQLKELLMSPKYALMFKKTTVGFEPKGIYEGTTWLEAEARKKEQKEKGVCAVERNIILMEFELIKKDVSKLLTQNLEGPDNERLDVQQFNLDFDLKRDLIGKSQEECKRTKKYLEGLIACQDKVTKWLKTNYWDTMKVMGKSVWGIFANFNVENYVLLPIDKEAEQLLICVEEQRKIEEMLANEDTFEPWISVPPSEMNLKVLKPPTITEEDTGLNILTMIDEEEEELDVEKDERDEETYTAFNGTISHTFQELNSEHYTQQQIYSFLQTKFETIMSLDETYKLKEYFNKQFENISAQKFREIVHIKDRNARLRHIISELNYFSVNQIHITIDDPHCKQVENPELIIKVTDSEVGITPYISPSQQAILDAEAAEAERIRLLLLADDFRERALMAMMNGVLEVRWEDELRKDVPIPKFMTEKEPEEYNEEDLRGVIEYEEKVKFLNSERERYKNILDAEYAKLGNILREGVRKFNNRLADLLLLKLQVDSAIGQENLKINRLRLINHKRIMMNKQELNIKNDIVTNENTLERTNKSIAIAQVCLHELREQMETLLTKEKTLEKSFRREFGEASPVIQELTLKLYKKRPKASIRNIVSETVLIELAKSVVTQEKSVIVLLNQDCIEFLKGVDNIDLYIGIPNTVDEQAYSVVCKHRRLKIECETKIRACSLKITEAENTLSILQRTVQFKKDLNNKYISKLSELRTDRVYQALNMELQIVIKQGFVEISRSGEICDFYDAILVPRQEVEEINKIIVKAGNRKLKAMRETMNFRKGIVLKEWEHTRLKMIIADLEEKIKDINSINLTKEIQSYLKAKARGDSTEKQLTFEQEIDLIKTSFERILDEKKYRVNDLQKQINATKKENKNLDKQIMNINVDVCEYKLKKDDDMEKREQDIIQNRMKYLLRRAKLVKQIQENHNEILVLQTELELVRLKVYPTLKYNIVS